eukprot:4570769-Amphidinium_carterae.1
MDDSLYTSSRPPCKCAGRKRGDWPPHTSCKRCRTGSGPPRATPRSHSLPPEKMQSQGLRALPG